MGKVALPFYLRERGAVAESLRIKGRCEDHP